MAQVVAKCLVLAFLLSLAVIRRWQSACFAQRSWSENQGFRVGGAPVERSRSFLFATVRRDRRDPSSPSRRAQTLRRNPHVARRRKLGVCWISQVPHQQRAFQLHNPPYLWPAHHLGSPNVTLGFLELGSFSLLVLVLSQQLCCQQTKQPTRKRSVVHLATHQHTHPRPMTRQHHRSKSPDSEDDTMMGYWLV